MPDPRRIVLFDWASGGHHAVYLRRLAEALRPHFEVVLAAPDDVIQELTDLPVERASLGHPRPAPAPGHGATWGLRTVLGTEVELMASVATRVRAGHLLHVYADAVLPRLATSRRAPVSVTAVLFYPRAHYPALYGTRLTRSERLRAWFKEGVIYAWRQRSDANAVLTLDEGAARRWNRVRGAPAYWLPEPPVGTPPEHNGVGEQTRIGCVLYGVLAERKGIGHLTEAMSIGPTSIQVTLAGPSSAQFQPRLEQYVSAMRATGTTVDVRAHEHTESDGLRVLAASRCAVLPYPHHDGMSRVLLEASSVGTPVVAHDRGLLGYLVRRHGLGHAVDCAKPQALRDAILDLTANASRAADFAEPLARFSAQFSRDRFAAACVAPFGMTSLQAAGAGSPIAAR